MEINQHTKSFFTNLLFGIILIIILAGCSVEQPIKITLSPTIISTETPTITITKTPRSTQTNTPILPTATSALEDDLFQTVQGCNALKYNEKITFEKIGGIIYYDPKSEDSTNNILIKNLETGESLPLDKRDFYIYTIIVSPDKKWIAYHSEDSLFVKNPGTDITIEISNHSNNEPMLEWNNNNEILFRVLQYPYTPIEHYFLNPFTKEVKFLDDNYPEKSYGRVTWDRLYWPFFAPSGKYALYEAEIYNENYGALALINLNSHTIDQYFYSNHYSDSEIPEWSHDGEKIYYISFYNDEDPESIKSHGIATTDGQITYLADFPVNFSIPTSINKSWSPEDRYATMSFVYSLENTHNWNNYALSIIDFEKETVSYTCMGVNNILEGRTKYPIWSPNSKQFLIDRFNENDEIELLLVDLETMEYGVIFQDKIVFGWILLEDE